MFYKGIHRVCKFMGFVTVQGTMEADNQITNLWATQP